MCRPSSLGDGRRLRHVRTGLSANAVTALRALGLHDGVALRGTRVRRAEIRNPRGELLTLIDYEGLGWETYGILRSELQHAMLEACRRSACAWGQPAPARPRMARCSSTGLGRWSSTSSSAPTGSAQPCADHSSARSRRATVAIAPGERERASMTNASATASSRFGASAAASASGPPDADACTGTASRQCPRAHPRRSGRETSSSAATACTRHGPSQAPMMFELVAGALLSSHRAQGAARPRKGTIPPEKEQ